MKDETCRDAATFGDVGIADAAWLELSIELADVGRWWCDVEADICYVDDVLLRMVGLDDPQPMAVAEFVRHIHQDDLAAVEAALAEAFVEDVPFKVNFRFIRRDGSILWLSGKGRRHKLPDGRHLVIGVNYDVSDLQKAVTANHLLAAEMSHRVQNLLSLVSGMFRMALRSSDNLETLGTAFSGRIDALGRLNDLIFESETRSVEVESVFRSVLGPLVEDQRVHISIDRFLLNGTAAQTLVLSVNELMTNAIKYGALSVDDVGLDIALRVDGTADTFDFHWRETVPRGIPLPGTGNGFGMTVLDRMTRNTFDGSPRFDWREDGMTFHCRWVATDMGVQSGTAANEARLHGEAVRATAAVQRLD